MSGDLAYLGLAEAAELIRTKKLSPVEYVTALLARVERYDAKYNAFIALTPERALTAARAAETEIGAGRWRGPFHGMPYALKDIIDVKGLATTAHSKILKGDIARRHAVVTERLEAAGGVLLGKLSTHEFAIGGPSFDPGDPGSADEPVPDYGATRGQGVRGLRIGVIRHFYTSDVAGHPEQVEALDAAVKLLAGAGVETREITLPALQDFSACGQIILAAEAYAVHEQWLKERPHDYGARARERLLAGATLRAVDYLQAVRWRLQLRDRVASAFANLDAAITASSMDPACRVDDDEALAANYWRQARMPFNVTGQPGLVIPAGFSKSGLPLSLQLVGHPFGEAALYRIAQFYEEATGWTKRHPPGLSD